jgi:hypothetical protein
MAQTSTTTAVGVTAPTNGLLNALKSFPNVSYAMGYGSGVFAQPGYDGLLVCNIHQFVLAKGVLIT